MKRTITTRFGLVVAMLLTILPVSAYDFEVDGIYFEVVSLDDLTCAVVCGDNKYEGDIVIPSEVTYNTRTLKVTEVGEKAFYYCSSLTSVSIPYSVTKIGSGAFSGCRSLTTIGIPDSVTEIRGLAFSSCNSLISIDIPDSVEKMYPRAFEDCSSMKSISLSNSIKKIDYGFFSGCESLLSLTIPANVEQLELYFGTHEYQTFYHCKALREVKIVYSDKILKGCNLGFTGSTIGLWPEDISFGYSEVRYTLNDITVLSSYYCEIERLYLDRELGNTLKLPYLKDLTLGEHITKVQIDPTKAESLESITCYAQEPPICPEFTNAQYLNTVVKVPNVSLEKYQQADGWKNFWNLEGFNAGESAVDEVMVDESIREIGRYDINGKSVDADYNGIVIVRYSDGTTKKILNK